MTKFNVKLRQGNEEAVERGFLSAHVRLDVCMYLYADVGSTCIYFFSSCVLLKGDGDEEDEVLLYCSLDGVSNVIYLSNNNNILP